MNKVSLWKYRENHIFMVFGEMNYISAGHYFKFFGVPIFYKDERELDTSISRLQNWNLSYMVKIYE